MHHCHRHHCRTDTIFRILLYLSGMVEQHQDSVISWFACRVLGFACWQNLGDSFCISYTRAYRPSNPGIPDLAKRRQSLIRPLTFWSVSILGLGLGDLACALNNQGPPYNSLCKGPTFVMLARIPHFSLSGECRTTLRLDPLSSSSDMNAFRNYDDCTTIVTQSSILRLLQVKNVGRSRRQHTRHILNTGTCWYSHSRFFALLL